MSDDTMQLEEVTQSESTAEETSQVQVPEDWNSLDGKSQDRFQTLANLKKQAERKAEEERLKREQLEQELKQFKETQRVPMPNTQSNLTQEEEFAYRRLKEIGVADQSYVDKKVEEKVRAIEERLYFDSLHASLENEFSSKKGYPAYNRSEIEEYMRTKQIYDPKAAYRDLYHDEIVATEANSLKSKNKVVQTESTKSRIGSANPWTKESLSQRLAEPDGLEFFKKNKEKILRMQSQFANQ